ncbi:8375_t:CDS:2, partial [Racocetra persica]
VVIATVEEYEIPKNFQNQFENAIGDVKKLLEKLEHQEDREYFQECLRKIRDALEHQEDKEYFLNYFKKINNQLDHFKDFDEKALEISDYFNYMINSTFEILSGSANLQMKIFSSIERLNNIDLESSQDEINLSFDETDEYLFKWINYCTEITDQFEKFFEDHSNLIKNIEDSLFFFEIQEEILTKIHDIKTNLLHNSEEIDKPKIRRVRTLFSSSEEIKKEAYSNFLLIIGLKLVYDLTAKLEYTTKEFWETLSKELSKVLSKELAKNFVKCELYAKE